MMGTADGTAASTFANGKVPDVEKKKCLEVAMECAKGAGEMIRKTFRSGIRDQKKTETDPVTETDLACEKFIKETISEAFPDHEFLGEESYSGNGDSYNLSDRPTWVCDPVDGTANFLHGIAWTCVSIALVVNKQPVVGVVYNPISEELFTAVKGEGAFLNETEKLSPSAVSELTAACICTEFGANRDADIVQRKVDLMQRVVMAPVQAVRCMGSCALNMCSVAAGRLDAYYEWGMHPWDVAASWLVCSEAGAVVSDLDGGAFSLTGRRTLVANSHIHPKLLEVLTDAKGEVDGLMPWGKKRARVG